MKTILISTLCSLLALPVCFAADDSKAGPQSTVEKITIEGKTLILKVPAEAAPGKPWLWVGEFGGHLRSLEDGLVAKGWHVAYVGISDQFGSPESMAVWEKVYEELHGKRGFSARPALLGISRGGLYVNAWTRLHPDRVSVLYLDNGVCDIRSWPAGLPLTETGKGGKGDWNRYKTVFKFASDEEAIEKSVRAADGFAPAIKNGVFLISVHGTADHTVPYVDNAKLVVDLWEKSGGRFKTFSKEGGDHHPHGLPDPAPLIELLFKEANPQPASQPVYLTQSWFHRGANVNLLTTPSGVRVAVDNDGRHVADESITAKNNRFARLDLDSLQKCGSEYYLALPSGFMGNGTYTWYRASRGGQFLDEANLAEMKTKHESALETYGVYLDYDVRRGISGLLLFPQAGLAVVRGMTSQDGSFFSVVPFGAEVAPVPFGDKDSVKLEFEPHTNKRGKRIGETPDGVIADLNGQGFWYIAAKDGKLCVAHARPGLKPDGGRTLNPSPIIPVADAATETLEAGVASDDALYLLLANENNTIGGVDSTRRLIRVGLSDNKVESASFPLNTHVKDAALALFGERIAAYAEQQVVMLDRHTLVPQWSKDNAVLADNSPTDYRIVRVAANADGNQLAVALATAYSRPDEPTRVIVLSPAGDIQQRWTLKPGSIDDLTFTGDGGWLLFSHAYTAKFGGSAAVRENEAAAIAVADKSMGADTSGKDKLAAPATLAFPQAPLQERHKLWFNRPGDDFLPLGNGTFGAMMFGKVDATRIVLNLDSEWAGDENRMGMFQSLGEINFRLGHDPKTVTDYRRELDLRTGLYTMTYRCNEVTYKVEAFCSYPRGLLEVRLSADKPGAISGQLELQARQKATFSKRKDGIEFSGQKASNGQKFACVMRVDARGGTVSPEAGKDGVRDTSTQSGGKRTESSEDYKSIMLQNCDSVTLYVAGDTDYAMDPANRFKGADPQQKIAPRLANLGKLTFDQMRGESAADVSKLFDRCTLDLATGAPGAETLPVDQRRSAYRSGKDSAAPDVGFQVLAFDAARYMMIACSRPGSLPANLQGLWNEGNSAAWTGDYHTDINVEMNYWFVEPANLAECAIPLFDYIESQIPYWRKKSNKIFGDKVRGWTVEYMNNIFGGGTYMNYPPGGAWLSWHYATHFEFGQDVEFLKKRGYPLLKELSEHWQDLLVKRPDGQLTTPRTSSPEHGPVQFGIAQDRQMVHEMLGSYIAAAARLKCDTDFSKQVVDMRNRIVPPQIGRWGQLQEWEADLDSRTCPHRHMMHLFSAFPGREINPADTPELAAAAVRSLDARGDGSTGWSKAWRISLYARLRRPDQAYRALSSVVGNFHNNLIWEGKQQIDAPCGYANGVCEVLLQSYRPLDDTATRFEIDLLPALPKAWPEGRVKGLRARGGFEVDIEWQNGKLTRATIRNISSPTSECTVRYGEVTSSIAVPRGESRVFTGVKP